MAKKVTQIRPVTRKLILEDGVPRVLRRDFNSLCTMEEILGPEFVAGDASHVGNFRTIAAMAYAFTATHREDAGEEISFAEFRKLMPVEVEDLERVAKAVTAVADVTVAEVEGDQGND
jgi:hypothetical protein